MPFAFVLLPFGPDFDDINQLGIQTAAKENDVLTERVGEKPYSKSTLERIYRQSDAANFIITGMSGRNADAFQ